MKIKYSPRLKRGIRRDFHLYIPDPMYYGLKRVAREERRSIGWVIEQIIEDWYKFGINYKETKKK